MSTQLIYYGNSYLYYKKLFLGNCLGLALAKRGDNDNNVIVYILTEDDGHWNVTIAGFSSYWLPDLIEQIYQANVWMASYCIKTNEGYSFKENV